MLHEIMVAQRVTSTQHVLVAGSAYSGCANISLFVISCCHFHEEMLVLRNSISILDHITGL
jgi:hypothetical protein